jgi:hypothetical protein
MPSITELEAMAGLWDQDQCALFLRVSTVTLAKWRKDGTGPVWRPVGNRIIYIPHQVMTWLADKEGKPARSRPFGGKLKRESA